MTRFVEIENCQFFMKEGAFIMEGSVFAIGPAGPVEGIDIFAVILDARAIDIQGRYVELADGFAEQTVTALGLAEGKRRIRNIDEYIQRIVVVEILHGFEGVVIIPAVFTDERTDPERLTAGEGQGNR